MGRFPDKLFMLSLNTDISGRSHKSGFVGPLNAFLLGSTISKEVIFNNGYRGPVN